jgi:hypothetical protein
MLTITTVTATNITFLLAYLKTFSLPHINSYTIEWRKRVSAWQSMRKGAVLTYFEVIYCIFLWDWAKPRTTALLTRSIFIYKETGYLACALRSEPRCSIRKTGIKNGAVLIVSLLTKSKLISDKQIAPIRIINNVFLSPTFEEIKFKTSQKWVFVIYLKTICLHYDNKSILRYEATFLVEFYRRFGERYYIHLHSSTLKLRRARSCEEFKVLLQITRCHIPESNNLRSHFSDIVNVTGE